MTLRELRRGHLRRHLDGEPVGNGSFRSMPSGDVGRPGWHKPVLALAILLVVGQVIAFIVLRSGKKDQTQPDADVVATSTLDAVVEPTPPTPTPTTEYPTAPIETPTEAAIDAAVEAAPLDAAIEAPTTVTTTTTTPTSKTEKRKLSRAEIAAQQKKERDERRREEDDRRRAEQQERERKKIEQERYAAEQAKAAAELERQKLAAQKAEADAVAAKAAAEKAKLEAAAKTAAAKPTPQGPDVLVLVLGPGTPSVSADQIRNVYLGRTSVWPNGTIARPLNRPAGTTAARKFYGGILKMNAGAFSEHWSEIQLGGGGIAPGTVSSGKVTVAKVAATTGGFGYVMESELPENTNGVRLVRLK